jgi:DNA-binding NarL/FixJ family response regulator
VIAGDGRTLAALRSQPARVARFERVESLLDCAEPDFCAVVLCVQSTISGLPGLIEPLAQRLQIPIVLVCKRIERWEVRAALGAGASGVITYENLPEALSPCLQTVLCGQVCVPRAQWRQIEPPVLSTREKQVLGLVVMGYMNTQIAQQLFVAESTVKSHLSSAFGKLGVRSRNEAVSLILDPDRGLGMGILALGGERLDSPMAAAQ